MSLLQDGLMSYEEEKINLAMKALEETEKKCQVNDGFMKSVRKKFSKKKRKEVSIRYRSIGLGKEKIEIINVNTFLSISCSICFGCSKELSH